MLAKKLESAAKAVESAYIEDVFSTYLYTGTGATQTITNGIDLSTKGGMVWIKSRSAGFESHRWTDSARGTTKQISSDRTDAQTTNSDTITSFNTTGFTLGTGATLGDTNASPETYASWTFRKQPKFFTCGTFTGDGTTNKVITHDLNGTTGCIIVKRTDSTGNWQTWHRTFTTKQTIFLNTIDAVQTYSGADAITVTDNSFTVGTNQIFGNGSGFTYVYYVFAHNAGGFGASGNDNVITCGSYVGNASTTGPVVTLGYEPQWVMVKNTGSSLGDWNMADNMRGMGVNDTTSTNTQRLRANVTNAESTVGYISPTATGFQIIGPNAANSAWNASGETYIYIAIRRGPMKVPTLGTSVFQPVTYTGDGTTPRTITTGIKTDLIIGGDRDVGYGPGNTNDRLRGQANLITSDTGTEAGPSVFPKFDVMNGYINIATGGSWNATSSLYIRWAFQRAPGFFDQVCYTGNGIAGTTITHNLTVAPELMIIKSRSAVTNWGVGLPSLSTSEIYLNLAGSYGSGNTTVSTATTFTLQNMGGTSNTNASGDKYVAYLFATCPGVSKVGSYTGNGSNQTINCGFTGGARFVLIKRTDSTGDWYVWDTARGIVSGNDPHLSLNTTAAEVTTDDTIDPDSTGFIVNQLSATNVNVSSATYIYLAIA